MPGFDESIPIPPHLELPRLDADETLPSQIHPSYPFGRPATVGKPIRAGPGNLLGTVEGSESRGQVMGGKWGRGERWVELGMGEVVEVEKRKEVPPGMAVSALYTTCHPYLPILLP